MTTLLLIAKRLAGVLCTLQPSWAARMLWRPGPTSKKKTMVKGWRLVMHHEIEVIDLLSQSDHFRLVDFVGRVLFLLMSNHELGLRQRLRQQGFAAEWRQCTSQNQQRSTCCGTLLWDLAWASEFMPKSCLLEIFLFWWLCSALFVHCVAICLFFWFLLCMFAFTRALLARDNQDVATRRLLQKQMRETSAFHPTDRIAGQTMAEWVNDRMTSSLPMRKDEQMRQYLMDSFLLVLTRLDWLVVRRLFDTLAFPGCPFCMEWVGESCEPGTDFTRYGAPRREAGASAAWGHLNMQWIIPRDSVGNKDYMQEASRS